MGPYISMFYFIFAEILSCAKSYICKAVHFTVFTKGDRFGGGEVVEAVVINMYWHYSLSLWNVSGRGY